MRQMIMRQVSEMRVKGNLSHSRDLCRSVQQPLPLVTLKHLKLKHTVGVKHIKEDDEGMKKYVTYLNF